MGFPSSIACIVICTVFMFKFTAGYKLQNDQSNNSSRNQDLVLAFRKGNIGDVRKYIRDGALEMYLAGSDTKLMGKKLGKIHAKLRTLELLLSSEIAFVADNAKPDKVTFAVALVPELTTTLRINTTTLKSWKNRPWKDGKKPLHIVCQLPDVDIDVVRAILDIGVDDVNDKTGSGATPILFAVSSGNFDLVRFLVEKGARLDDFAVYPINSTDQGSYYAYMKLFSTKEVIATEITFHFSPLVVAAWEGYTDILKFLIDRGADVGRQGWGVLFYPAIQGMTEIVEILLKNGVDVNTRDTLGSTTLHKASEKGQVEVAKLLLKHRANVNATDNFGCTPLHVAALFSRKTVIELLIDAGGHVEARTEGGSPPLNMAVAGGSPEFLKYLVQRFDTLNSISAVHSGAPGVTSQEHLDVVELLISSGASFNTQDRILEWSPLHWAAASGDLKVAKHLVKLGAVISTRSKTGLNPLMTADHFKRKATADFLKTAKDLVR